MHVHHHYNRSQEESTLLPRVYEALYPVADLGFAKEGFQVVSLAYIWCAAIGGCCVSGLARGVWGHAPPQKIRKNGCILGHVLVHNVGAVTINVYY